MKRLILGQKLSAKLFMKPTKEFTSAGLEIYLLYREYPGVFSAVSGNLRRNDSSKLSRQLNPTDDRRDNPFTEVLEILLGTLAFSPKLEEEVWRILERERSRHRKEAKTHEKQVAELVDKVFGELSDVSTCALKGGTQDDWEKETFELVKAAEDLHEQVKNRS